MKPAPESKKSAPGTTTSAPDRKQPAPESKPQPQREAPPPPEERPPRDEPSLGRIIASARERRGYSSADAAKNAHIPPNYLRMIESDDYSSVADQLYLLPFLRRYATFVGLDPEEVASRFVRDVQRADMNATRMSEPIQMADARGNSAIRVVVIAIVAAAVIALAWFGYRHFRHPRGIAQATERSLAAVNVERALRARS